MDYSDYKIIETTVWGNYRFIYNFNYKLKMIKKSQLLHDGIYYPFIDHCRKYALVPNDQKKTVVQESQTFLISYAYNYDHFPNIEDKEKEFINQLNQIELTFYKKKCLFNEKDAYLILIMDTEANLEKILDYLAI